jgi:class 3 adenylate cyclase/DNA-binding beta-propeller fold protein YncE
MPQGDRGTLLATLLFTDIVGSSDLADQLGDRRWRELLARHHALVRRLLKRFSGRELDTAGDGFFAAFTKPAEGVRCAAAISDGVRELGIEIRAGLHVGEAEVFGSKLSGVAVHIAARTMSAAGPREVLVTGVLRDLVPGAGFQFEDRGTHALKGIPGEWRLFAVTAVDGQARTAELEPAQRQERLDAIQAPRVPRRARAPLIALIAVAVAVGIVASLLTLSAVPTKPTHVPGSKDELELIDPTRRTRTGSIPLSFSPGPLVFSQGSMWVLDEADDQVLRIDPARRKTVARITVGDGPVAIAASPDSIWIANGFGQSLSRIDPGTDQVTATIDLGFHPLTVAAGDQAAWAAGEGTVVGNPPALADLVAIDPTTNRATEPTKLRSAVGCPPFLGVASGEGLAATAYGEVWKLDPRGADPSRLLGTSRALAGIFVDAGTGTVWLGNDGSPGSVVPLDVASRRLGDPIPVGTTGNGGGPGCNPVWIARGGNYLWVTNFDDRSITVIAAVSMQSVGAVPLDGKPVGLAFGVDQVWVAIALS